MYEIPTRGNDLPHDKLAPSGGSRVKQRVPGAQILGEYRVLLILVTSIGAGNTREYPSFW